MSDTFCKVNISEIDLTDDRYQVTKDSCDIDILASTILKTGLIYPPILRPVEKKFIVISGVNRIKAVIANRGSFINALIVPENTNELDCIIRSIHAVSFKRSLNHFDLIQSVSKLKQFLNLNQISDQSYSIFNQSYNLRFINQIDEILNLPDQVHALIEKGHLSFKSATRLNVFKPEDLNEILSLFRPLKMSSNKQLEIITHLYESSSRDKKTINLIFDDLGIKKILKDPETDIVRKIQIIRDLLSRYRFPILSETKDRVRQQLNRLNLDSEIQFLPSENLEDPHYTISFKVKTLNELKSKIENLSKSINNPIIKEILNDEN